VQENREPPSKKKKKNNRGKETSLKQQLIIVEGTRQVTISQGGVPEWFFQKKTENSGRRLLRKQRENAPRKKEKQTVHPKKKYGEKPCKSRINNSRGCKKVLQKACQGVELLGGGLRGFLCHEKVPSPGGKKGERVRGGRIEYLGGKN